MLCFTNINRATSLKDGFTNNLQFSAPDNAKIFRQILESWQRQTSNIFAWDYSVNFTDTMSPFPNFSVLQPNIQFLREKKIPNDSKRNCSTYRFGTEQKNRFQIAHLKKIEFLFNFSLTDDIYRNSIGTKRTQKEIIFFNLTKRKRKKSFRSNGYCKEKIWLQ